MTTYTQDLGASELREKLRQVKASARLIEENLRVLEAEEAEPVNHWGREASRIKQELERLTQGLASGLPQRAPRVPRDDRKAFKKVLLALTELV